MTDTVYILVTRGQYDDWGPEALYAVPATVAAEVQVAYKNARDTARAVCDTHASRAAREAAESRQDQILRGLVARLAPYKVEYVEQWAGR